MRNKSHVLVTLLSRECLYSGNVAFDTLYKVVGDNLAILLTLEFLLQPFLRLNASNAQYKTPTNSRYILRGCALVMKKISNEMKTGYRM